MKRQLAKLYINGTWTIEWDDSRKYNQYGVYYTYYENGNWHKKQKERYADMVSCVYYLLSEITGHERRMIRNP